MVELKFEAPLIGKVRIVADGFIEHVWDIPVFTIVGVPVYTPAVIPKTTPFFEGGREGVSTWVGVDQIRNEDTG